MKGILRGADGSEEVVEMESLTVCLGDSEIEITTGSTNPNRLQLHVGCKEDAAKALLIQPRAANTVDIEIVKI